MSRLIAPLVFVSLFAACEKENKPDPVLETAAETCKCLNSGDWLAAVECDQTHQSTLDALQDKPALRKKLADAVDACRPADRDK